MIAFDPGAERLVVNAELFAEDEEPLRLRFALEAPLPVVGTLELT